MTNELPTNVSITRESSKNEPVTIELIADDLQQLVAAYRQAVLKLIDDIDPAEVVNNFGFELMTGSLSPAACVSLAICTIEEKQIEILEKAALRLVVSKNPNCKLLPVDDETVVYHEFRKRILIFLTKSDPSWGKSSQVKELSRGFAGVRAKLMSSNVTWIRETAVNSKIIGVVFRTQGKDPISEHHERNKDTSGNSFEYIVISGQMAWAMASNGNWNFYIELAQNYSIGCESFGAQVSAAQERVAEKVAIEVISERERLVRRAEHFEDYCSEEELQILRNHC